MHFNRIAVLFSAVSLISACGVGTEATIDDNGDEAVGAESELGSTHGRFETFVGHDGQYYFHLLAGNGEKVLASEGYASLSGAQGGIASVQANGTNPMNYLLRQAADGASYFVLTAANGQIIGVSEMYVSQSNATRAVTSTSAIVKDTVAQGPAAQGNTHFGVFKGLDGKYYFHLKANNGEIVMQSQGYSSKSSANSGVASVQTNGSKASRYTVLPAADGKFYFVLRAANGQIIGRGQTYASQSGAQAGVNVCIGLLTPVVPVAAP